MPERRIPDEVTIGPFTFTFEEDRNEMCVSRGEDQLAMVDHVWPEVWQEFVEAVAS